MSYKNLEIWKLSRESVIEIHTMTLTLPKFEQFKEAQQIRRSIETVKSTIVEGYGRRKYKADFIKYLIYALSSNDETMDRLETLFETKSFVNESTYTLLQKLDVLGRKLNNFIKAVEQSHNEYSA